MRPTFSIAILAALALTGCQTVETVTTVTAPDGTQTTTLKRPVVDPFDASIAIAAERLMEGGLSP